MGRLEREFDTLLTEQGAADVLNTIDHVDDIINRFLVEIDMEDHEDLYSRLLLILIP